MVETLLNVGIVEGAKNWTLSNLEFISALPVWWIHCHNMVDLYDVGRWAWLFATELNWAGIGKYKASNWLEVFVACMGNPFLSVKLETFADRFCCLPWFMGPICYWRIVFKCATIKFCLFISVVSKYNLLCCIKWLHLPNVPLDFFAGFQPCWSCPWFSESK